MSRTVMFGVLSLLTLASCDQTTAPVEQAAAPVVMSCAELDRQIALAAERRFDAQTIVSPVGDAGVQAGVSGADAAELELQELERQQAANGCTPAI